MDLTPWGVALLRVTLGGVFLAHGIQKATAWGLIGGAPFFHGAGIPLASVSAPLVTLVELGCGALLLSGYATRLAAGLLSIVMAVALVTVHLPHGFFLPYGYEFVLTLCAGCCAIALTGPGRLALDGSR